VGKELGSTNNGSGAPLENKEGCRAQRVWGNVGRAGDPPHAKVEGSDGGKRGRAARVLAENRIKR